MATRTIYFDKCAETSFINQATHYTPGSTYQYDSELKKTLLIKTTETLDNIKFKPLKNAVFFLYATEWSSSGTTYTEKIRALTGPFDETSVTDATKPYSYHVNIGMPYYKENVPGYGETQVINMPSFRYLLSNGASVTAIGTVVSTPNGPYKPYVVVEYEDEDIGLDVVPSYPIGAATISKALDTTFSWYMAPSSVRQIGLVDIAADAVKFRWRYAGSSGYTEINAGTERSYTVPANTFTSGTIEWQVEATANSGVVTTTEWTAVEVKEPLSSALIVSPKNNVIDGASGTVFRWEHVIPNATPQTGYDIQISADNALWETLISGKTADTFADIPANTFKGGDLYWRVRTYNSDSIAGEWSEAAHCIVIAAPDAPAVTVTDEAPRFEIRWQQIGQQAYEIELDGKAIARKFGVSTSYRHTEYLTPGLYLVRVRIQNKYSLWSDWGITQVTIKNVEGEPIMLSAEQTDRVTLALQSAGNYSGFIIYRNGVKIGETSGNSFTDHFALGAATYQVRGIYADSGYYTLSNAVNLNVSVKEMMIAEVADPQWLSLARSASSLRETSFSASRSVTYTNFIGAELPGAEIGEHASKSFQLEAAWKTTERESIEAFERLLGKLVCIKTPYGRRIVGILNQGSCRENQFVTSYSAVVTLVDWEEG